MEQPKYFRSAQWFNRIDHAGFEHRTHLKARGHLDDMFDGRPVIGIANSASDLVPCNAHLTQIADAVSRGVLEAGGFPLVFPTMSIGDSLIRPTGMLFRNLMSMELEELLRSNPLDGVVLLSGCDNTAPAYLMGAASVNLPTILVHGGPMINGSFRGHKIGSGTDIIRLGNDYRVGKISKNDFVESEVGMSRSIGHCNTIGTAATMGGLAEALGMSLPGTSAIPAVDSRRLTSSQLSGRRIVQMVKEGLCMSDIISPYALENAIKVNAAVGGSTNAILHLIALAGRLELPLTMRDVDRLSRDVPLLANLQPNGKYLMEDFYLAGGMVALMNSMSDILNTDAFTVSGSSVGQNIENAEIYNEDVIRPISNPVNNDGGLAVLFGNLAPNGAVIKPSAASKTLMRHRGRAVVFENIEELEERIDSPHLDVDENSVLVLKDAGPRGYPGMSEVGNMRIPKKLLDKGITDIVRISDGRMSGTAFGTVILHVSPESLIGGPLSLVKEGDIIEVDVDKRSIHLDVGDLELEQRQKSRANREINQDRGYTKLFKDHVLQADKGCDFDFLVGRSGSAVPPRKGF
ncbi:MAG TPA: dihydroxy-acid dehydratase [Alphaproteobacteria bacterium]|nr:dihydroxy-acid dehydratase [Alphaproteobacteria bacterium]